MGTHNHNPPRMTQHLADDEALSQSASDFEKSPQSSSQSSFDDGPRRISIEDISPRSQFVKFQFPTRIEIPQLTELISSRLRAIFASFLSSIPFLLCIFALGQYWLYVARQHASEPQFKDQQYLSPLLFNQPNRYIFHLVGDNILMYTSTFLFAFSLPPLTSRILKDPKIIASLVSYTIFQAIITGIISFLGFHSVFFTVAQWLLPFFFGIFIFHLVRQHINSIPGVELPFSFVLVSFLTLFFAILITALYSTLLLNLFFHDSDPLVRFSIRIFFHPILTEFALFPYRFLSLWLSSKTRNSDFQPQFEILVYNWQFLFGFLGRYMVSSFTSLGQQVVAAAILALEDQMFRTSMLHRDRLIIHYFPFFDSSTLFQQDPSHLYASWYLWDELSESVSILSSVVLVLSFKLLTHQSASQVQSVGSLIALAVISIILEVGTDLIRIVYYSKIPITDEMLSGSWSVRTTFRIVRFWRSLEYAVHNSVKYAHPRFKAVLIISILGGGIYGVISLIGILSIKVDLSTGNVYGYL